METLTQTDAMVDTTFLIHEVELSALWQVLNDALRDEHRVKGLVPASSARLKKTADAIRLDGYDYAFPL